MAIFVLDAKVSLLARFYQLQKDRVRGKQAQVDYCPGFRNVILVEWLLDLNPFSGRENKDLIGKSRDPPLLMDWISLLSIGISFVRSASQVSALLM